LLLVPAPTRATTTTKPIAIASHAMKTSSRWAAIQCPMR
jgi:hypothetical protein